MYAEVILPLALTQTLTYAVPEDVASVVEVGMRVIVPVGKSKFYTGIVARMHEDNPGYPDIKSIASMIDERPTVTEQQLKLWRFVGEYYCSSLAEVYRTALPPALRIESEQDISLVNEMLEGDAGLTRREREIVDRLSDGEPHRTAEFAAKDMPHIRKLIERGVVANNERLVDAYRPRYRQYVSLAERYRSDDARRELMEELKRAKKQQAALECYLALCPDGGEIERSVLVKEHGIGAPTVKAMVERGVFCLEERQVDRIDTWSEATCEPKELSKAQAAALEGIKSRWAEHRVVLLHGAPASGKTEIYVHLISECLSRGGQALLLVPETGLTRRLTGQLKGYFGGAMGTYHAQCTNYERVETYNKQLSDNPYGLIVGVRSAVFLPYRHLQLIIVDDEHDTGYKQTDPAPRYHGRDMAVFLSGIYGANVLLGSATPSIESYANCHFGKYGLVSLSERYGQGMRSRIRVTDMNECRQQRRLKGHFSFEMIEAIKKTMESGHQVIVFQNRRGFAPYTECRRCGYVPRCPNCDVSLTVHRHTGTLTCHYCGHTEPWVEVCPQCHEPALSSRGFGTEQVEAELRLLFPEANIDRLDLDTSRSMKAYDRILAELECGNTDILVGTQMVTKGIDAGNVALVCIVNADNLLYHADFRAYERAYHLLGQAIGRTGRGSAGGMVMIQTSQPENPVIRQIVADDYLAFFKEQMVERHAFHYPPYYRLVRITVKHTDRDMCHRAAVRFAERLRLRFANRVLGPDAPAIARIQNRYIQQIMLKIEIGAPITDAKRILMDEIAAMRGVSPFNSAVFAIDVDPQ